MKNCIDMPIFHTAICFRAEQIAVYGRREIVCTNFSSPLRNKLLRNGDYMIVIDYKDTRPIYEQIVERFKLLILKGAMHEGEQMPSVRNLAMELSINPNTIQKAYTELERQGFIYTVKGRGNFVCADGDLVEERKQEYLQQILVLAREILEIGMTKDELMQGIRTGLNEMNYA